MSKCRIGVCSWSLAPRSVDDLVHQVRAVGVECVQLALDPIRRGDWGDNAVSILTSASEICIVSGMMATLDEDYSTLQSIRETGGFRSDVNWNRNLAAARDNARLARSLGISLVTFHAGFIPEQAGDPVRLIMVERLQRIIDEFASCHVNVAFETGQETVQTLLSVLKELERPDVGVNFDPANIILYDKGDPVEALQALNTRVTQVHIKDARHTTVPGTWGTEVPAGTGAVNWKELFACAQRCNLNCDFIIERESGDDRIGDIIRARRLVGRFESDS